MEAFELNARSLKPTPHRGCAQLDDDGGAGVSRCGAAQAAPTRAHTVPLASATTRPPRIPALHISQSLHIAAHRHAALSTRFNRDAAGTSQQGSASRSVRPRPAGCTSASRHRNPAASPATGAAGWSRRWRPTSRRRRRRRWRSYRAQSNSASHRPRPTGSAQPAQRRLKRLKRLR